MSELRMRPLTRNNGIYVRVDGLGQVFRFRLGSGSADKVASETIFIWHVAGDVGEYFLQLIPHTIPDELPPSRQRCSLRIFIARWVSSMSGWA